VLLRRTAAVPNQKPFKGKEVDGRLSYRLPETL
jgi:hypothetical protein